MDERTYPMKRIGCGGRLVKAGAHKFAAEREKWARTPTFPGDGCDCAVYDVPMRCGQAAKVTPGSHGHSGRGICSYG
jgi:hypothetical protein